MPLIVHMSKLVVGWAVGPANISRWPPHHRMAPLASLPPTALRLHHWSVRS